MAILMIFFDHSDRTYSPGDTINLEFRVRVRLNTTCTYRSIYMKLQGFSYVEFNGSKHISRRRKSKGRTVNVSYSSDESFFKYYETLAGAEGGPDMELSAGTHVYHVSFQLPQNIPENHESRYGHIRYNVKMHMDVPWAPDKKETMSFFVRPRLDLNDFPALWEPIRVEASKTFSCCCWQSEPLRIFNILPRRGFVPGDCVPFALEMNNDSEVRISTASVKLVERIVYHANRPDTSSRDIDRTLWKSHFDDHGGDLVASMQNKIYSTDLHLNPNWDFHFFNGCGIITVHYLLMSKAHTSGCLSNLSNCSSFTMGTIPLGNSAPEFTSIPPFPNVVMPSPADLPSAPPGEQITDQPLPTYNDVLSKDGMMPHRAEIGLARPNSVETPPPIFSNLNLMEKKEKQ